MADDLTDSKAYGAPVCICKKLPHEKGCPVAPFFSDEEKITLDSEQGDYHDAVPFIIVCPKGCRFLQFDHAVDYDYTPMAGSTEQTEIPMVCPVCSYSDKQLLPTIIGHDFEAPDEDVPFKILCPNTQCQAEWDRSHGNVDVWLEREVCKGVEEVVVRGFTFKKGQVITEYTELSITCYDCGHSCGEDED